MHKVRVLEREAQFQAQKVEAANNGIRTIAIRDVGVFQGATLAGTGLLSAAPPGVVLSEAQKRRDAEYQKSLVPQGGMPTCAWRCGSSATRSRRRGERF